MRRGGRTLYDAGQLLSQYRLRGASLCMLWMCESGSVFDPNCLPEYYQLQPFRDLRTMNTHER